MLTLTEAADRLGMRAATLRQQIHAGQLRATKVGPIWVVDEVELARYTVQNRGRVGRAFVGRAGYVDTRHVRVRLFLAPADGRGHTALWLQYLRENFVLDLDYSNPERFVPTRSNYEQLDLLTEPPPGGRTIELWNRDHVALEIEARPFEVDLLCDIEPSFPRPIVRFRDGGVWDADQVQRWLTSHRAEQHAFEAAIR